MNWNTLPQLLDSLTSLFGLKKYHRIAFLTLEKNHIILPTLLFFTGIRRQS